MLPLGRSVTSHAITEPPFGRVLPGSLADADERVVKDVLRVRGLTQDAQSDRKERRSVAIVQLGHGMDVALGDSA